jgi:L-asparagine transporter-like permease
MALRLILLCIPLLTFFIPSRWFGFYAGICVFLALFQFAMIVLLHEEYTQAFASFGLEAVAAYILVNLLLLLVRRRLIRRARSRTPKLPAPHA